MAKYELVVTHNYSDNEKAVSAQEAKDYIDSVLSSSIEGWSSVYARLTVVENDVESGPKVNIYSGHSMNLKAKSNIDQRHWPWKCSAVKTPDAGYEDVVIAAEYDPRFGWHNVGSYEYDQERQKFISEDDENPIILKPGQNVWWRYVQIPDFVPPQNKPITNKNE